MNSSFNQLINFLSRKKEAKQNSTLLKNNQNSKQPCHWLFSLWNCLHNNIFNTNNKNSYHSRSHYIPESDSLYIGIISFNSQKIWVIFCFRGKELEIQRSHCYKVQSYNLNRHLFSFSSHAFLKKYQIWNFSSKIIGSPIFKNTTDSFFV